MHAKVQTWRLGPAPVVLAVLLLLIGLARCRQEEAPAASAPADTSRFGTPYEITLGQPRGASDALPHLVHDTLVAHVAYAGGCATHGFVLDHRTAPDTARLWIRHDDAADSCSTQMHDVVHLPLPQGVRQAGTILLLNPQGGAPFILRWGDRSN